MTHFVKVQDVAQFLLQQEKFLSKVELTYAKSIFRWLPYREQYVDTEIYLQLLREKNFKSHRQHALFAMDVFESCGASYATVFCFSHAKDPCFCKKSFFDIFQFLAYSVYIYQHGRLKFRGSFHSESW